MSSAFTIWTKPSYPPFKEVIQSWYTPLIASYPPDINKDIVPPYSCCTTWGIFEDSKLRDNIILVSVFPSKKMSSPSFLDYAKNYCDDYLNLTSTREVSHRVADKILIEIDKEDYSHPILQNLRRRKLSPIYLLSPEEYGQTLEDRFYSIQQYIEDGRVILCSSPTEKRELRDFDNYLNHMYNLYVNKDPTESFALISSLVNIILYLTQKRKVLKHSKDKKIDLTRKPLKYRLY